MSVTADQLSKLGVRVKDFNGIVQEQLRVTDDALRRAERSWGRNVVIQDLPTSFPCPGLDKRAVQRIVYSAVIHSLKARGFIVRILLEPERTACIIEWVTDLDEAEVKSMDRCVRDARISSEDLAKYLDGVAPAGRGGEYASPRPAAQGEK